MKLIKFIGRITKDIIKGFLEVLLTITVVGFLGIIFMALLIILPTIIGNATGSLALFILTFILQIIVVDLIINREQSEIFQYFKDKWED